MRWLRLAVFLGGLFWTLAPAAAAEPSAESWAAGRVAAVAHEAEPLLKRWGYPAILGAVTLDTMGIPAPAAALMAAAGVAAARQDLSLTLVLGLACAGAIAGSQLGFLIGRLGGRLLLARLPLSPERVAAVERAYDRWGVLVVLVAPFADGLRQLNGLVAGLMAMRWWHYTLASTVGNAVWVALWVGGPWLADEHAATILTMIHAGRPWLIAAAIIGAAALLLHLRTRRPEAVPPAG